MNRIDRTVLTAAKAFANKKLTGKLKGKNDFSVVLLQNGLTYQKPF